jgi:hypothetical protein
VRLARRARGTPRWSDRIRSQGRAGFPAGAGASPALHSVRLFSRLRSPATNPPWTGGVQTSAPKVAHVSGGLALAFSRSQRTCTSSRGQCTAVTITG